MSSSAEADRNLWIVVLAGGIGSRFWPVSTPSRPKQLLPLAGDRPLVEATVRRALELVPPARLRVLTGTHLESAIRTALPFLPDASYLIEPAARGTAPVLAWAAWTIHRVDPDAVIVSLHSDHVIEPPEALGEVLREASRLARDEGLLLTVAVEPDRPETGFGYILPGEPLPTRGGLKAFRVGSFVEKPDLDTAREYVKKGYLWNSGIFVWSARTFLDEVRSVAPDISALLPLLDAGDVGAFFRRVPVSTVDVAVLERSSRVGTVKATFRWDDVGSWEALARTIPGDADGNVTRGDSFVVEGKRNIVYTEGGTVVLFGVDDLVAVRTGTVTLVTRRELAPELKRLLSRLPDELSDPEPKP